MPREHGAQAWLPLALLVTHPASRRLVTRLPPPPRDLQTRNVHALPVRVESAEPGPRSISLSPPHMVGARSLNSHHTQPVSRDRSWEPAHQQAAPAKGAPSRPPGHGVRNAKEGARPAWLSGWASA